MKQWGILEQIEVQTGGAWARSTGKPCIARKLYANDRCKLHVGLSTGPKTKAGKQRVKRNLKAKSE